MLHVYGWRRDGGSLPLFSKAASCRWDGLFPDAELSLKSSQRPSARWRVITSFAATS